MKNKSYHYNECGLYNICLLNGFKYSNSSRGSQVTINNIDELHKAIGCLLINQRKNITGKEIRFLREEMLMSRSALSHLLMVRKDTVNKWEQGKSAINKAAERLIRMLYAEYIGERKNNIKEKLKKITNIDNASGQQVNKFVFIETINGWKSVA